MSEIQDELRNWKRPAGFDEIDKEISSAQAYADKLAFERYKAGRVSLDGEAPEFCQIAPDGYVEFNFHPGQTAIMDATERIIVATAGRQGAKTSSVPPWLLEEIIARGPGLYMAVAPSFPLMEDSLLPKIVDLFGDKLGLGETRSRPFSFIVSREGEKFLYDGTRWAKDAGTGILPKTVIRFCHARNAASLEAKTALGCVFDEAGQDEVKAEAIEAIEGRLTTTQGRLLLTTTPYNMGWLYRRYVMPFEAARAQGKKHPYITVITWPSYLNPAFPKHEYDRQKTLMPAWKHAMFYDGKFTRPAGQIYDCFSDELDVCEPFTIPDSWPRYMGMDFGGSNTAAVYLAEDPESGTLYLYRTYLGGNKNEHEHLRELKSHSQWSNSSEFYDRVSGGAGSEDVYRELYRRAGHWVEKPPLKGGGSVEAGIDCVYSVLARHGIKIFRDQTEMIHEINTYSREIDPETGDVIPGTIKDKAKFHRADALRYICATLMRASTNGEFEGAGRIGMSEEYERAGEISKADIISRVDRDEDWIEAEVVGIGGASSGLTDYSDLPSPELLVLPSPF